MDVGNGTEWAGKNTENSENLSMSAAIEAPLLITRLIGRRPIGESQKAAFNRAARAVNKVMKAGSVSPARLEDIYRGEARRIDADEMDALRAAAQHPASIEARNELSELRTRLAKIEAALCVSDPDFHSAAVDALRVVGGSGSRAGRALDRD